MFKIKHYNIFFLMALFFVIANPVLASNPTHRELEGDYSPYIDQHDTQVRESDICFSNLQFPPPTDLVAEVIDYSSVRLLWNEPDFEGLDIILTGYNIYRNEEIINPAPVLENSYIDCCLIPEQNLSYYVTALYNQGESAGSNIVEIYVTNVDDDFIPLLTQLHSNYPNPFNPQTVISFTISEPGQVIIEIYNSKGQRMRTLTERYYETGSHSLTWDGRDDSGSEVKSGMYLYRMKKGDYVSSRKMILLK